MIALAALSLPLGCGLYASWSAGSLAVAPTPSEIAPAIAPARDVALTATDGATIAATYWPGADRAAPAVLLLHGNGASRAAMAANAQWLAGRGYAAMAIDFRGHGQSAARPHSFGLFESRDALAALRWLKQRSGGAPVAVIGVSLGGAAALIGDEGPVPADAMVLQAVYPDIRRAIRNRIASQTGTAPAWLLEPLLSLQARPRFGVWPGRLSPITAIARYRGPVLVIGGEADPFTPPAETRAIAAAAAGPSQIWIAPGADHGASSALATPEYRRLLADFLQRSIGAPRPR